MKMYEFVVVLFSLTLLGTAYSADPIIAETTDFQTIDEILYREPDETPCATAVFANGLAANAGAVSEYDDEQKIEGWIRSTFSLPDVLNAVLACPEFQSIEDTDHIKLQPIRYTFPAGREIVVNYETQPTILKQRIDIATKRNVDKLNTPSPKIGELGDTSLWTNTDPAWYAIMVTQHNALNAFVGPDKNNTISLEYIENNIDSLYPSGATCTSKSAMANDSDMINIAVTKTVGIEEMSEGREKDSNDYYVAGDANLQWVSYAEIALDVVITVVTWGTGAAVTGAAKAARAAKTTKNLRTAMQTMRALSKTGKVADYVKMEQRLQRIEHTIARIRKYQQLEKDLAKIDKVKDASKYTEKAKELEDASQTLRNVYNLPDATKYSETITELEQETKNISKSMSELVKTDKEIEQYAKASKSYSEIKEYYSAYRNLNRLRKNAKTGNVAVRLWRAARATTKGNKILDRGAKVARSSMKSGRVRDWLFQSTMRNIGKLGRFESNVGLLYAAVKIGGDMYDWTETSTGDFTNGIEFKPLLLLSADDIEGQENVVNYGMWLMWNGDSTNASDDDAAYLQAMDFAEKFHSDLLDVMDEGGNHACDVDIYVVRPVLRNPDTNAELYYLIMNDKPWTTAE